MKITRRQLRGLIKETIEKVEFNKEEFEKGYWKGFYGIPPLPDHNNRHKDYKLGYKNGLRDATLRGPLGGN